MGDGDGSLAARLLVSEPGRDTTYEAKDGFAAVRCSRGIAQPRIGGVGLMSDDLAKGSSGPPSVITLTQHRLDARVQSKRFGGLAGPQLRTGPTKIDIRQASDKLGRTSLAVVIERFVHGEGRCAHRIG
jgi:hypothetical protein